MPIPIVIPLSSNYSCTVSGTTFKLVTCEECSLLYVYRMTQSGSGSASMPLFLDAGASDVAGMQAHATLQRRLEEECDPVPCKRCGHYQANMVTMLKRNFQGTQLKAANVLAGCAIVLGALGAGLTFVPEERQWALLVLFGGIAVVLMIIASVLAGVRSMMLKNYEPNAMGVEERLETAREYAKTLDEFRSWLAERGVTLELKEPGPLPAPTGVKRMPRS